MGADRLLSTLKSHCAADPNAATQPPKANESNGLAVPPAATFNTLV
jgi:hypothetical protein